MRKPLLALILVFALATSALMVGCGAPAPAGDASGSAAPSGSGSASGGSSASATPSSSGSGGSASASSSSAAQLPNPQKRVSGLDDFKALNLRMSVPTEAADVSFYIIGEEIAEVDFLVNDTSFIYRGSAVAQSNLSGVYEEFSSPQTQSVTRDGVQATLTVEIATSGILRATWTWPEGNYSLIGTGSIPQQNFTDIAVQLAQAS
ncbi:MAG: hypothetical protein LBP28_00285 [Coriobacteriales bacterium]|jgi:hypothetical protein|nr:hypothetical protein [Coriobacteriales bacterium]